MSRMQHFFGTLAVGILCTNLVSTNAQARDHRRGRDHGSSHARPIVLQFRMDREIEGRNRVHLNEMFSLNSRYYGMHLDRIEVHGTDRARRWETASTIDLVNELGENLGRKQFPSYGPIVFRTSDRHLGRPGTHYDLILDGSIDVEKFVVVLSEDCDGADRPEPRPPVGRAAFELDASIEDEDFRWFGRNRSEIYFSCLDAVERRSIRYIDKLRVGRRDYRNALGYWSRSTACGVVALMATPKTEYRGDDAQVVLSATIDGVTPIRILSNASSRDTVASDLDFMLQKIVSNGGVSSLRIWDGNVEYPRRGVRWSRLEVFYKLRSEIRR